MKFSKYLVEHVERLGLKLRETDSDYILEDAEGRIHQMFPNEFPLVDVEEAIRWYSIGYSVGKRSV